MGRVATLHHRDKRGAVIWHPGTVRRDQRPSTGLTVWFTGLSGSGKSTVAAEVERRLVEGGRPAYLLDGDNLRHGINADLGFTPSERTENVRRVGEIACLFADAGLVALVAVISPYRIDRERARRVHHARGLRFWEVFVDTPLELCETRDPKGLYARARGGQLPGFTAVTDPYERPERPELRLTPGMGGPDRMVEAVLRCTGLDREV